MQNLRLCHHLVLAQKNESFEKIVKQALQEFHQMIILAERLIKDKSDKDKTESELSSD